ncbi:MAG: SpoIIE family protein phosphatase [Desulfobacterales bacterium]|jgi:serine phosphatase RsbU (regulator of sigma subunit)
MLTPKKLYHLKNEMLVANFLANLIGVVAVNALMFVGEGFINKKLWQHAVPFWIDTLFTPFAFIFVCVMTLRYERPIRRYLTAVCKKAPISDELAVIARQRLLNEPFVLISYDFSMWLLSAIVYPMLHWIYDSGPTVIQSALYHGLSAGVITITVAFFLLEHILQKKLAPYFFPQGGLYAVPKTLRIRIRTRLAALLFACNLIPLFSIIVATQLIAGSASDAAVALVTLRKAIITNAVIFILAGVYLIGLVSRNLTMPFAEIIQTLQGVRNGKFDKKVRVTSNDEIGYTGDVINEMTEGLRERDRIRRSLGIAMEVQQHLLPRYAPEVEGLDIAGQSLYCEETGGDYFDYLPSSQNGQSKIKIMVGDVSDHGIASALLMTTARAFLRQRASRKGNLSQIVTDVNRQLSRDVEDSGRFMTLFICEIDGRMKTIRWVNGGHDPAVIFDQTGGDYEELAGRALPLGVSEKASYQEYQRRLLPGQIILIGTDGIWESQNARGQMFGKKRFRDVVRTQARQPAADILQAVITALDDFCHPLAKEDDVTLVVVKVEE